MKNITNRFVIIFKNERLKTLIEYEKKRCYLISSKIRYFDVESWIKKTLKLSVVAFVVFFNVTFVVSIIISIAVDKSTTSTINQKFVTLFNITVYNTLFAIEIIVSIAKVFFNLWKKMNSRWICHSIIECLLR